MKRILFLLLLNLFICRIQAQRPQPRWLQQIVYDETNKQVLVFSGAGEKDGLFNDLWALKDTNWRKLSDGKIPGRIKAAFAYDAGRQCAVLFGGSGVIPLYDETWEWDGSSWKQIKIPGPAARNHPMSVYDPKNKQVLLFGGFGEKGLLRDTWVYDGKSWIKMDEVGPENCLPHGIVFDETNGRIVMITMLSGSNPAASAGSKNEMWEWTGHSWKKLPVDPLQTSQSLQALSAFGKGGIVLFDGDDVMNGSGKTWEYKNGKWKGLALKGPSSRVGHSMVFDKQSGKTILFGGGNRKVVFNDLWFWDGSGWTTTINGSTQ